MSAAEQSARPQATGTVELRWGLLGVLQVTSSLSQADAVDEVMRGRLRGALDELAVAMTRALEDELQRHDARIGAMVQVLGEETIPLVGGRG